MLVGRKSSSGYVTSAHVHDDIMHLISNFDQIRLFDSVYKVFDNTVHFDYTVT